MAAIDYAQLVAQKKAYLKGATPDQRKAINYFIPNTGCAGLVGKVSDQDYDAVVKALINSSNSYNRALDKIGMDESELQEIPPVTLYGYESSPFSTTTPDGAYRTNLYSITHLFFSSSQVYMYKITLNTMKNEKKERTEEYFYKDITNFSTTTETEEALAFKGCLGTPTRVSVETQQFALIVPGDRFSCATYGDIDQQVRAMKNKLREKKI